MVDVFPAAQQSQIRVQLSSSLLAVFTQTLCKSSKAKGGAFGRVMAQEIMVNTPAISNLIREGKTAQLYSQIQTGAALGMQTLERALANLVIQGQVSREEAGLRTTRPEELERLLS
jgi:twitching motility protein PilT